MFGFATLDHCMSPPLHHFQEIYITIILQFIHVTFQMLVTKCFTKRKRVDTRGDNPTMCLINRVKTATTNTNVKIEKLNKH